MLKCSMGDGEAGCRFCFPLGPTKYCSGKKNGTESQCLLQMAGHKFSSLLGPADTFPLKMGTHWHYLISTRGGSKIRFLSPPLTPARGRSEEGCFYSFVAEGWECKFSLSPKPTLPRPHYIPWHSPRLPPSSVQHGMEDQHPAVDTTCQRNWSTLPASKQQSGKINLLLCPMYLWGYGVWFTPLVLDALGRVLSKYPVLLLAHPFPGRG